jgi:acetyltransferase-like isoleucine patch superfamily enzyme
LIKNSIGNANLLSKKGIKIRRKNKIKAKIIEIGNNVIIEDNVELCGEKIIIKENTIIKQGTKIKSKNISIGYKTIISKNCKINVLENFCIGNRSVLCECNINGRKIVIGNDFFSSNEPNRILTIGGGGSFLPTSFLKIGNQCTIHNVYINIAKPVKIGNNVGISPLAKLYTHYFWKSIFEGYPQKFEGIDIADDCIIGAASIFLPGTSLESNCIVGAGSVITKKFPKNSIIGGNPAKVIRKFTERKINIKEKIQILKSNLKWYFEILSTKGVIVENSSNDLLYNIKFKRKKIQICYDSQLKKTNIENRKIILTFKQVEPKLKDTVINLKEKTILGLEDELTDDLRDFLRKLGIRIFTERKFTSLKYTNKF